MENHIDKGCVQGTDGVLEEVVALLGRLLTNPRLPDDPHIPKVLEENANFQKLYQYIMDVRDLSFALSQGDLHKFVYSKGYILSNLKALQSNLRHMTWQTKMVSEGDFTQRLDFLGDFSDAFNDMTVKLRDTNLQLQRLASLDALTQIPNRMAMEQFLSKVFAESQDTGIPVGILMVDLDYFKSINDTYGHTVGDQILIAVSDILSAQFRTTDLFARYGGEEFVACLPGVDLEMAKGVANRAREAVERAVIKPREDLEIRMTVSIGISMIRQTDTEYLDIIQRSDQALYKAKKNGRNQVCIQD